MSLTGKLEKQRQKRLKAMRKFPKRGENWGMLIALAVIFVAWQYADYLALTY